MLAQVLGELRALLWRQQGGHGLVEERGASRAVRRELDRDARARTVRVLKGYADKLKGIGVEGVCAVSTEALRRADDSLSFIMEVKDETGLDIEIISGEEEARRTLLGIGAGIGGLDTDGWKLLVDIGGGSTEFISTVDMAEHRAVSLPLGAVTLYERYLLDDPPTGEQIFALEAHCLGALRAIREMAPPGGWKTLVGTAGTITTLAAVDMAMDEYDPGRITGHTMSRQTVSRLMARFMGLSKENRKLLAGLEAGREDIILSGTAVLAVIMDMAGVDRVLVCDYGLLEGNLLNFAQALGGA